MTGRHIIREAEDLQQLELSLERAIATSWLAFQPIVHWPARRVFGYEALLRTDELSLSNPVEIIDAAERLGSVHLLGRAVRSAVGVQLQSTLFAEATFVNLHALDLLDDTLMSPDEPLSKVAKRVVLEITERASLDEIDDVRERIEKLRALGYRIALDDLGAGYAGLTTIAQLEPDVIKLDMSLIRGVDQATTKQKLIGSMTRMCRDMGMLVIAEGVETVGERDVLTQLGCELLQGYIFARPARGFPVPEW